MGYGSVAGLFRWLCRWICGIHGSPSSRLARTRRCGACRNMIWICRNVAGNLPPLLATLTRPDGLRYGQHHVADAQVLFRTHGDRPHRRFQVHEVHEVTAGKMPELIIVTHLVDEQAQGEVNGVHHADVSLNSVPSLMRVPLHPSYVADDAFRNAFQSLDQHGKEHRFETIHAEGAVPFLLPLII